MNCANHPDLPVSAYCQNCGKPLCTQCVRSVAGVVYCEPCLAARLHPGSGAPYTSQPSASTTGPAAPGSTAWARVPGAAPYPAGARPSGGGASPVLAGFLGAIPGVGAMYNGQFVKAFAHVIIFVIVVSVAQHFDPAGILVAAWVFYQIFDAVQTAIARREGRPLPDPFGLNDLGQRLGVPPAVAYPVAAAPPIAGAEPGSPGWASPASASQAYAGQAMGDPAAQTFVNEPPPTPMPDPASPEFAAWAQRAAAEKAMRDAGFAVPGGQYQSVTPLAVPPYVGRPEPIGAIVLIAVGMLFLLSTLGVFRLDWIGRGWPVIIIAIGAWLLFRRLRAVPRAGGGL